MWYKSRDQAAKELAPVLAEESSKTRDVEWLRYRVTLEQISSFNTGFVLTDELARELRSKMSAATSQQLGRGSPCEIKALDVRTDHCHNVTLTESYDNKLILNLTNCCGCIVGKTIDFDVANTYWKDGYSGFDGVFYALMN